MKNLMFFQGKWSAHSGLSISMGSPRRYIWCWALKVKLRRGSWPWLFQCFLAGRQGETKKPFASILLLKNLGFLVEFCWVATDWKVCHSFWRCPAIRSQLLSSWLRRLRPLRTCVPCCALAGCLAILSALLDLELTPQAGRPGWRLRLFSGIFLGIVSRYQMKTKVIWMCWSSWSSRWILNYWVLLAGVW